jgi:hypothetical protein
MTYRVTHEFKLTSSLPSQAELDRMLARLRESAPEGDVAVALGLGRVEVSITVAAGDPVSAAAGARAAAEAVMRGQPTLLVVEPAGQPAEPVQ